MDSIPQRIAVQVADLYINPPRFYEIKNNYSGETASTEKKYLTIPGHVTFRGVFWGGIIFFLTLFGIIVSVLRSFGSSHKYLRALIIIFFTTLIMEIVFIKTIFLPAQRYVLPLVPLTSLWAASGFSQLYFNFL